MRTKIPDYEDFRVAVMGIKDLIATMTPGEIAEYLGNPRREDEWKFHKFMQENFDLSGLEN